MKILKNMLDNKLNLRTQNNFPIEGVEFIDINPLILQGEVYSEIIDKMYDEIKDCSKIAEILNIDPSSVSKAVKSTGKTLLSNGRNTKKLPKIIHMYSLNDEYKKTFPSVQEAVRWCVKHNLCKKICSGARSHIAACANGERKTAYQHKWKYADNTTDSIKS